MKSTVLPLVLLSVLTYTVRAQNSVGIGTNTPNPNAVLHLVPGEASQGLLIPGLSTAQRTEVSFTSQLSSAENGLLVYDTDDSGFYHWADTVWAPLASGLVGGALSGPLSNLTLNPEVVATENIVEGAITSSAIGDNTIETRDIASPGANKVLISTDAGTVFWENLNLFETVSLSQGFVYVGSTSNEPTEVDMRGQGNVLIGNGTTATAVNIGGDISLNSAGVARIRNGRIIDNDINEAAGIAVSKLQNIPAGSIIFGDAAEVATVGPLSGDATINANGELVLSNSAVARANLGLDQNNVNITGGVIGGVTVSGIGSGLTNLNADNMATGTLNADRLPDVTGADVAYGNSAQNNPITSITVDTKGRVTAASVGTASDQRLKRDWTPLTGSLAQLQRIQPYTYFWKEGDDQLQMGVMAQEVEKVYPDLISTRKDGYKTVNYTGLIPPVLNALQEQQQQIEALQEQLAKQERAYEILRQELAEIREMLAQPHADKETQRSSTD